MGWKLYSLYRIRPMSKDWATRAAEGMRQQGFTMEVVKFGRSYAPYIIAEFRTQKDALEYKYLLDTNAPNSKIAAWDKRRGYGAARKKK